MNRHSQPEESSKFGIPHSNYSDRSSALTAIRLLGAARCDVGEARSRTKTKMKTRAASKQASRATVETDTLLHTETRVTSAICAASSVTLHQRTHLRHSASARLRLRR